MRPLAEGETEELFTRTSDFWQAWVSQSRYRGRWREMVQRSALVLKLLVYHPTGALVAAPTTSLPEQLGGGRNWDYRYSWLRDAAFTIYALMTLGFLEEAASFMEWVQRRCETATAERDVMIMYTVDGRRGPHRDGPRPSRRLPGLAAGPDRQQRGRAAAARRVRRADGLGVPVQPRGADLLRPVDRAVPAARLAGPALAGAGRGHLGDPRPAAALHLLGPDDLGGLRPGRPPGPGPRPAGPGRAVAQARRRRRTGSCRNPAGIPSCAPTSCIRAASCSTPRSWSCRW